MEEETEKMYEDIVKFCRENHTSFVDYEFPPNDNSFGEPLIKSIKEEWNASVIWLRPNQIVTLYNDEGQWSVFNDPQPSDVVQSRHHQNCSFISAMAVIADRPDILDKIFPSKEYSPEGVYRIRLYIDGQWKTIIVDDYFPCFKESNGRATATAKRKQLWVQLIEKALAKVFGSYWMFEGGTMAALALSMLTGACSIWNDVPDHPDNVDLFWSIVKSTKSSQFLLCASSIDNDFRERKGIAFEHAYSILDLNDDFGNRLLLLRNPWGQFEWEGKWSTNWDGWPSSGIAEKSKEKGVFWIELDDFMNKFRGVTICKIRPNWHEFREEVTIGLDTSIVRFTVTETCEASFVVISKREINAEIKEDIMISVHRISEQNIVGEMIGRSKHTLSYYMCTDDILLTPGQYIIMLFNFENMNKISIDKTVLCYSSKPISHELMTQTPQMFNQAIREIVLKDGTQKINVEFGVYRRTLRNNFRGFIFMADNFLKTQYLHLSIDCSGSEHVKSSRGTLKTTDVIPPMSYQIITILTYLNTEKSSRAFAEYDIDVNRQQFIGKDTTHDRSIVSQSLQHYPIIDPLDPIHYPQSIFYDSVPIEVETTERKCQKRMRHFLRKCDCRT